MLYRSKELKGRIVCGRDAESGGDGEVGEVVDIYFDDSQWVVRYLVIETGRWFNSRQVLVSPSSLAGEQPNPKRLKSLLTRQQIKDSPDVDTRLPVSRQYEIEHAAYYGYPLYWMGGGLWGPGALPFGPGVAPDKDPSAAGAGTAGGVETPARDTHLRSCNEVIGYHIAASDGEIGHLDDFLVEPRSWSIRRLIVETRNWLPGKHVQVDPQAIDGIDWSARKVRVNLSREQVRSAPETPD